MSDEAAEATERVRFCTSCGEVVAFEVRTCPACGHDDPLVAEPPTRASRPCPHCRTDMDSLATFCARCGREREPAPPPLTAGPLAEAAPGGRGLEILALVLTLLGPLALLAAVLSVFLVD